MLPRAQGSLAATSMCINNYRIWTAFFVVSATQVHRACSAIVDNEIQGPHCLSAGLVTELHILLLKMVLQLANCVITAVSTTEHPELVNKDYVPTDCLLTAILNWLHMCSCKVAELRH